MNGNQLIAALCLLCAPVIFDVSPARAEELPTLPGLYLGQIVPRMTAEVFTPTFVDSGQNLGDGRTFSIAVGDVDDDGDLDAFVANYIAPSRVWINDGDGSFSDSGQSIGPSTAHGVALGDVDGDDDLDAYLIFNGDSGVLDKVFLNDGGGRFQDSGQDLGLATDNGLSVTLADIDSDGDLDALVSLYSRANRIWINDGAGRFTDAGQRLGGPESRGMAIADLDSDGDVDIYLANSSTVDEVWLNNGHGHFSNSGQSLGTTSGWGSPALGDLDGDGDFDALVTNSTYGNSVWINDGDGELSPFIQYFGHGDHVALGDLEPDGDLDAFTVGQVSGDSIWINDGTGSFAPAGPISGSGGISIALGDVDNDQDSDVFIGKIDGYGGNRLHVCTVPRLTLRRPSGRLAPLPIDD